MGGKGEAEVDDKEERFIILDASKVLMNKLQLGVGGRGVGCGVWESKQRRVSAKP